LNGERREHEDVEKELDDHRGIRSLQCCGLRKFYECPNMWAQKRLLQLLIGYWNPEADAFMLDGQSLTIEVDDIYFIIGLIPKVTWSTSELEGDWNDHRRLHSILLYTWYTMTRESNPNS
jgi:hypothetical protein